ncbi:unnamed protein product, partial [Hapterophycus canaliculatus]
NGDDAKRYLTIEPQTFLLFPYEFSDQQNLLSTSALKSRFPLAWKYLNKFQDILEARDGGDLKGDEWYRFSRNQSLDKVGFSKLYIAGTAPEVRCSIDLAGDFFLTGGRVDGVIPADQKELFFLLGILNSTPCNFVFKRIARIKVNNFFEANKQFIAPLPIPNSTENQKQSVGSKATSLQKFCNDRRDLANRIAKRSSSVKVKKQ